MQISPPRLQRSERLREGGLHLSLVRQVLEEIAGKDGVERSIRDRPWLGTALLEELYAWMQMLPGRRVQIDS
jgi:hypothetical protein